MKKIGTILLIFTIFTLSSCAWFQKKDEKTAEELAAEGMNNFKRRKYEKSLESFRKLKDWYPFSKYAILAELKIADSHYYLKEYEDAIAAYEEFESLHPRNEAIPYVIYQIGRCYFEQIDTIDRDQTSTLKALEMFTRLINQFPESEYAIKAKEHIKKCHHNLAAHEFYVGMFYYNGRQYKAALNRFEAVLNYTEAGDILEKAKRYIELCKQKTSKETSSIFQNRWWVISVKPLRFTI